MICLFRVRIMTPPEQWTMSQFNKYGANIAAALPPDILMKINNPQVASAV